MSFLCKQGVLNMKKGKDLLLDGIKALGVGILTAAVLGILLFLGGFLFGGFQVSQGLEIAKDGLLLVAALGMFMIAGMLMVKGKNPEKFEEKDSWRKQFRVMGYKSVFGMICVAVLAAAAAVDYLMILMK